MGYAPCPFCESLNVTRQRTPNGFTQCRDCGASVKHAEWDLKVAEARIAAENPPSDRLEVLLKNLADACHALLNHKLMRGYEVRSDEEEEAE